MVDVILNYLPIALFLSNNHPVVANMPYCLSICIITAPNPPTTTEQLVQTTASTTSAPTERATTERAVTTILATTTTQTITTDENTIGPPIAPQTDATTPNGNTDTTGEVVFTVGPGPDSTGGNGNVGIIIGVVLGLSVALLVVIIICVVIVIARRRLSLKLDRPGSRTGTGGGVVAVSFNNEMYVAGMLYQIL